MQNHCPKYRNWHQRFSKYSAQTQQMHAKTNISLADHPGHTFGQPRANQQRRMLRTNPFNADGEMCEKKD